MKNTLLSVIAIMALCACNDDPEPAPRFQAIQQLYEMYGEKLIGEWENEHLLKRGDNLIMTAFGAGFVHGASYYTWAYDGAEAAAAK